MSVPSFFDSLFGELIPGGDCSSIEQDPNADPFDKEVCQHFRRFNDAFGTSFDIEHRPPLEESERERNDRDDPQSLRDAILSRPQKQDSEENLPQRPWQGFGRHRYPRQDEDLDEKVGRDPRLLEKYLKDEGTHPPPPSSPHYHSSYSSVVITRKPDGIVEERRTTVDSDGNEKTTVTYSDGDSHRKSESRHDDGIQQRLKEFWDKMKL